MPHRLLVPSLLLTAALSLPGLAACSQDAGAPERTSQAAETTDASPTAGNGADGGDDAKSGTASAKEEEADLKGKVIAIDPGHNGGNADHPERINRQVPDGRGGTKACNTTGTSTNSDYPEADFTWAVAKKLQKSLTDAGAEVVLSRKDNAGVGPCVDERGQFADDADVLVSIHANGSESSSVKGFHIIVADPGEDEKTEKASGDLAKSVGSSMGEEFTPNKAYGKDAISRRPDLAGLNNASVPAVIVADPGEDEKTEKASVDLAKSVGTSMGEEFTPNKAYGKDAISRRPDLAGLNNASVPAVIVECGEMRNPSEAELMESKSGQKKYADALFDGIVDWF